MTIPPKKPLTISQLPDLNKIARVVRLALKTSENIDISIPKLEHALAKCINEESVVSANRLLQAFDLQGQHLIGAIVKNTSNSNSYIVIFDDQGGVRLPLTEFPIVGRTLYKRLQRIEAASAGEIPWLSIELDFSETEENLDAAIFQAIQAKRKGHPFAPRRISLSYERTQDEPRMAYGGLMLTMLIPCHPYLPVSLKYRIESVWEVDLGFSSGFTLSSQPFHHFHLFSYPENSIEIPLQLLDIAWRYNFDEIRQFSATPTLRPKQLYRPSDFGIERKGVHVIRSINDVDLPASVKEIVQTHAYYREYRNDEVLPDGTFFGRYGEPFDFQGNSISKPSTENRFMVKGHEKEVFLSRDHSFDFLERLMKFAQLIDALKD